MPQWWENTVVFRSLAAVLVITAMFVGTGWSATRRTITAAEAQQLVYAMLDADDWTKLPGFVLYEAPFAPEFHNFYLINAEHDNPGGGSAIGHYAVERATGEVWDWAICGRFTSPTLIQAQAVLRRYIGLTDSEYRNLRKPGPFCAPGQTPQTLEMGKPRADPPPVRIRGQVTDRLHGPIANAKVVLKATGSKETVATSITDRSGRFTFPMEPSGGYDLHFQSPGFLLAEMRIAAVRDMDASIVMEVAPIEGPAAKEQPTGKSVPRFEDFLVATPIPFHQGPTYVANHVPDFEKEILDVAKEGPDFAGQFVVEQFTCGSACTSFVIVNIGTSTVFRNDFNVAYSVCSEGHPPGAELMYRPDSRLLIVTGAIETLTRMLSVRDLRCRWNHRMNLLQGTTVPQEIEMAARSVNLPFRTTTKIRSAIPIPL